MNTPIDPSLIIPCAIPTNKRFNNLSGRKFGRLTVIELIGRRRNDAFYWRCLCECGTYRNAEGGNLVSGHIASCGCFQRENIATIIRTHGLTNTPEYRVWRGMITRCTNSNARDWDRYGGRGISVCERWKQFENFLADMGPRPTKEHTLDRVNNNGNYEPRNCRWATMATQARNKRTNRMLTFKGETLCVSDWANITGLKRHVIYSRLNMGWTIERALTAVIGVSRRVIKT